MRTAEARIGERGGVGIVVACFDGVLRGIKVSHVLIIARPEDMYWRMMETEAELRSSCFQLPSVTVKNNLKQQVINDTVVIQKTKNHFIGKDARS